MNDNYFYFANINFVNWLILWILSVARITIMWSEYQNFAFYSLTSRQALPIILWCTWPSFMCFPYKLRVLWRSTKRYTNISPGFGLTCQSVSRSCAKLLTYNFFCFSGVWKRGYWRCSFTRCHCGVLQQQVSKAVQLWAHCPKGI